MGRWRWVWWLLWAFVVSLATSARAGDLTEIRVCVRPPNLPPDLAAWAYTPSGAGIAIQREDFKKRYPGGTVYVFDPAAPAANTQLLPIPYNKLECPARVLPVKPIAPPPPDPKKADRPKAGDAPPSGGGKEGKNEKEPDKDEAPPGTPKPIAYPNGKPPAPPQLAFNDPKADEHRILPTVDRNGRGPSVLPLLTSERGGVLPFKRPPGAPATDSETKQATGEGAGSGDGAGKAGGVTKTAFEKFAEEMAYAGAVANQQFSETDKHPNGSRYGLPGGKNVDGPKSPVAQAAAGGTLVVIAIVGASGLDKKLMDALKKKAPLILKGGGKVAEEAAEKFVEAQIAKHGDAGRHIVADALNKNGAIGEYSVMKKFTDKLGGQMQAHHIIEQRFVKDFKLGNPDRIPAVLLTDAEHKAMTARLRLATSEVLNAQELWEAYKKVYAPHPDWLAAIKAYFVKGK